MLPGSPEKSGFDPVKRSAAQCAAGYRHYHVDDGRLDDPRNGWPELSRPGAQPPQADLGSMLGEGRAQLFNAPHVSIVPGLMIFLLVISLNVLGDGVRDVLDPRLRSSALGRPGAITDIARDRSLPMIKDSQKLFLLPVSKRASSMASISLPLSAAFHWNLNAANVSA